MNLLKRPQNWPRRSLTQLSIIVMGSASLSCERSGGGPPQMPPPTVEVAEAESCAITQYFRYNGTVRAIEEVEIRARVRGFIEKIAFQPSSDLKKGDLLFVIEQAPFKAAVDRARGRLEQAKARLKLAEVTFNRIDRVYKQNAASEDEFSTAKAELDQRKGEVLEAQADLDDAEIQLSYTEMRAPLAGRVDEARVDVGDLVGVSEPTLLCTIVQMSPIHAYFDVSERIALQYLARGEDGSTKNEFPLAFLGLANEKGYPHQGQVDYVDNVLDSSTGTITVRAIFDNSDHRLYPGLYARIRVPFEQMPGAVMIQEAGVAAGLDGKYVLTLDKGNIVGRTPVKLGERGDGGYIQVSEGLSIGQRYIVAGLQFARPGMPVQVKAQNPPNLPSGQGQQGKENTNSPRKPGH
ncbi:MAG: efflux RND transporter periplasmic adaptor subunit [Phycisphaerales bacterium]|nr:efflux RND transporter periplasmic adaptor subunit [Phycisphaerales bacterium]